MPDTKTLYLIDGTAQIFRAFYAVQTLSKKDGTPTNAIFGFIKMLLKLIQNESPHYLGVCFDPPGATFRHEMYAQYKAHRPAPPEELIQQIAPIKEFVRLMNIPVYEVSGYEADDALATLAKKAEQRGMKVVIVTSDKDLLQLVTENVFTMSERMGHKKIYTPEAVQEKYGIMPSQIRDFLGMVGDSSDNIPGIKGIGPKTAGSLLTEFGSLEAILEHPEAVKSKKQQERLRNDKEIALQSKDLATVRLDVPLELNVDELQLATPDYENLRTFFHDFEFYSLIRDVIPGAAATVGRGSAPGVQEKQYDMVLTEEEFEAVLEDVRQSGGFAVDTETTSKHPMQAELVGISLSTKPDTGYYIPLGHRSIGSPKQLPLEFVITCLKPILEDPSLPKYGQNIKYDMIVLSHYGIRMQGVTFDSMLASYVLNPSKRSHGMDSLAEEFLSYRTMKFEEVCGKGAKQTTIDMVPVDTVTKYAAEDADVTLQLTNILKPQLEEHNLGELYEKVELPLIDALATMEHHGVKVDVAMLQEISTDLAGRLLDIQQEIYGLAGQEFNINSPKQLGSILFEKHQMPGAKKTKTGYSTNVDVLTDLARAGFDLPARVLDYRQLAKLKSTYSDALPKQILAKTGRIHSSFNQTVTVTGRLSSSDPNLQNIPVRTAEGRKIRQAFIPEDGCLLLSADYSQIELRIMAHATGDPELQKAYREDEDIHTKTATQIFGLPAADITPDMRREAKTINFSVIYGIGAFSLSKDLNIPRSEAQRYIDEYFAVYKGVKEFMESTIKQVKKTGYVTTLLNRIRYIPEIKSRNNNIQRFGERTAVNSPIQGTAADMIKLAMIAIHTRLLSEYPNVKMIMQVHDELVFEVPESVKDEVKQLVVSEMESVLDLDVPIKVEADYGKNWDEAH